MRFLVTARANFGTETALLQISYNPRYADFCQPLVTCIHASTSAMTLVFYFILFYLFCVLQSRRPVDTLIILTETK